MMRFLISSVSFVLLAMPVFAQGRGGADWEAILDAARKEGKVVASIPPSAELRRGVEIAFTRRYGIAVEFVPARGGAIIQRIVSEAKAGKQYFDLHIGGTESAITGLLPENMLAPVEPFFLLPEVRDARQWWGGHIWVDNAKRYIYNFIAYQTVSLWCNPNEYKAEAFKSFDDLLEPKLHGRIGISDPRTPGSGSSMWSHMHAVKGPGYLKKLVAQKLWLTRDLRLLAESLARGRVTVTSGIGYSEFQPFIKAKLPVVPLPVPREGLFVSGGYGHLTVFNNLPHPNAAKVFINWLLSRDGQEIFSRAMGVGTRRLDVNTHWLKEFGIMAAKDYLNVEQFYQLENQSEQKIQQLRAPASALARKLLGS